MKVVYIGISKSSEGKIEDEVEAILVESIMIICKIMTELLRSKLREWSFLEE